MTEKETAKMSPMMEHYLETKKLHPDCLLFYRLGDFYEMFFDDAKTVSRELELVLTGKDCGMEERAPMCGVPFHAAESYITRLVRKGYKVAVAEQMEDPKLAKGLVKREVIRIVTPGTLTETDAADSVKNNYLVCIAYICGEYGLAAADIGTGEFLLTQFGSLPALYDELSRLQPPEIVVNDEFLVSGADTNRVKNGGSTVLSALPRHYFVEKDAVGLLEEHFGKSGEELGLGGCFAGAIAAGAVLRYIYDTQFSTVSYITKLSVREQGGRMVLDHTAIRNLELLETLRDKEKKGSLLWVLDKTRTAMGGRLLRNLIVEPLTDREQILKRQDAVEELSGRFIDREEIAEYLGPVYDLERLISRMSTERADTHDLLAFRSSIAMLPAVKTVLRSFESPLLVELCGQLDELSDLESMIGSAISEDAPVSPRDGGIILPGYNAEVDRLRNLSAGGKDLIVAFEQSERERTGIRTLKVKFNKIFGYSIEITNAFLRQVPDNYIRKQTLTTCERFITPELQKMADDLLTADEKLRSLEYEIFSDIRRKTAENAGRIQQSARVLALLDVLCSFSQTAQKNNYVRPKINEKGVIRIRDGRHPVVERMLGEGSFVANDTLLDNEEDRIAIITGPNMAGKSTYMRQVALIVLMAQIGSFVPASQADIAICDRIFTRVGASDDLASGQSTFMIEMNEVAGILRGATERSLIILDEIGRGTSTFDGLSIAWAVVEYIAGTFKNGGKTIFATHYHELTELEGKIGGVHNYCIAVKENEDDLIFLRKIVPGGADKSYGIAVAKLAGVPKEVTDRAMEISEELVRSDIAKAAKGIGAPKERPKKQEKQGEKERSAVLDELARMDVMHMSPIEALLWLNGAKEKLGKN